MARLTPASVPRPVYRGGYNQPVAQSTPPDYQAAIGYLNGGVALFAGLAARNPGVPPMPTPAATRPHAETSVAPVALSSPQATALPPPTALAAAGGAGGAGAAARPWLQVLVDETRQINAPYLPWRLRDKQRQFRLLVENMLAGPPLDAAVALQPLTELPGQMKPFLARQRVRLGRARAPEAAIQRRTVGTLHALNLWCRALLRACGPASNSPQRHALALLEVSKTQVDEVVRDTLRLTDGSWRRTLVTVGHRLEGRIKALAPPQVDTAPHTVPPPAA